MTIRSLKQRGLPVPVLLSSMLVTKMRSSGTVVGIAVRAVDSLAAKFTAVTLGAATGSAHLFCLVLLRYWRVEPLTGRSGRLMSGMIERFELMCSDASALAAAVLILCSSPLVADHIYPCIVDGCCRSKSVGDSRSQMACGCRHS